MKKLLCLLLVLAVLLSGCMHGGQKHNLTFYYRDAEDSYFSDLGVMSAEARVLYGNSAIEDVMELYMKGPVTSGLTSPFPKGVQLVRTVRTPRSVTLIMNDAFADLPEIAMRVAAGCAARTVWDYNSDFETLKIKTEHGKSLDGVEELVITPGDLVLSDRNADQPNVVLSLYYADAQRRFLLEEQRSIPVEDAGQLPEYILRALIEGPQSDNMLPIIPENTLLLSASVIDGECIANFSQEFMNNRPQEPVGERLCIFSVVNSLCQLDEVETVRIQVGGDTVGYYGAMDLSEALTADAAVIGPVRSGAGEFDASLYLCMEGRTRLVEYPMCLRETAETSQPQAVVEALVNFEERNGFYSLLDSDQSIRSVTQEGDTVTVSFAQGFLDHCDSQMQKIMLERSVIASLCALDGVRHVRLFDGEQELELNDLIAVPQPEWFIS